MLAFSIFLILALKGLAEFTVTVEDFAVTKTSDQKGVNEYQINTPPMLRSYILDASGSGSFRFSDESNNNVAVEALTKGLFLWKTALEKTARINFAKRAFKWTGDNWCPIKKWEYKNFCYS